jgi:hypothetical protein
LSLKQLFEFVTNPNFGGTEEEADQALEKVRPIDQSIVFHCSTG